MSVSPDDCAREVLDVIPLVMRSIRAEMRSHRGADLSVPQFRAMVVIDIRQGASLSDVAEFIGLTLPSASKLVDGLVSRRLVLRKAATGDRRRIRLSLTPAGRTLLQAARDATQACLAKRLVALSATERATVAQAMQSLRGLFLADLNPIAALQQ